MPCTYLDSVLTALQQVEKDRIQSESITSAYLTDSLHAISHAVYGDKDKPYKSNPAAYLPGYEPEESEEDEDSIEVSIETIAIFMSEIKAQRMPSSIVATFSPMLEKWRKLIS